jgi:hypothetical protein
MTFTVEAPHSACWKSSSPAQNGANRLTDRLQLDESLLKVFGDHLELLIDRTADGCGANDKPIEGAGLAGLKNSIQLVIERSHVVGTLFSLFGASGPKGFGRQPR